MMDSSVNNYQLPVTAVWTQNTPSPVMAGSSVKNYHRLPVKTGSLEENHTTSPS